MRIEEYQILAKRTCASLGDNNKNYSHMKMGVITEIGELLDIFKKNLAYNKEIDIVNLGEEIADMAWYIVNWDTFNKVLSSVTIMAETTSFEDVLSSLDFIYGAYSDITHDDCLFDTSQQLGLLKSIAEFYNLNFEQLLERNIEKLKIRFPDKFTEEQALNRDLESERQVLENGYNVDVP